MEPTNASQADESIIKSSSMTPSVRTKLTVKRALLHFKVLCLRPDGRNVKCRLRGWSVSFAIVSARLRGSCLRNWVWEGRWCGRQRVCCWLSLFLLKVVNAVKKQGGGALYSWMTWIIRTARGRQQTDSALSWKKTWSLCWDGLWVMNDVLIKSNFIAYSEVQDICSCSLAVDGGGVQSSVACIRCAYDHFFCHTLV